MPKLIDPNNEGQKQHFRRQFGMRKASIFKVRQSNDASEDAAVCNHTFLCSFQQRLTLIWRLKDSI